MEEEKEDSDQRIKSAKSSAKRCIKALCYKSIKNQQKNYCSNICQILTPLLCLLFTIVVKIIMGKIITFQMSFFNYPVPIEMPIFYAAVPQLNLSCQQVYYYQTDLSRQAANLLSKTLKKRCGNQTYPKFRKYSDVNSQIIQLLKVADKEPFQRGQDLRTEIPDGLIKIHNISGTVLNITMAINDFRLPEYHKNNGVTKVTMRHKDGSYAMLSSYLRVTEGAMSLSEKLSRSFLSESFPKEVIVGSYMYMPFSGQDRNFMDKTINIIGSALYPLALSLLLPLFLYSIISEKESRLIEIMKMNGLNVRYYWLVVFLFNFTLSILVYGVFYTTATYFLQISLFLNTSGVVMWVLLVGWAIAQISLTTLIQIFISDSKSATIVGYVLSVFSTLTGQPLCIFVYSAPLKLPILLLLYPPFALCRGMYLVSLACSNDSCFNSIYNVSGEFLSCLLVLYSWFFMFILSIWLNDVVQQDYGVAHSPKIIQTLKRCLLFWRKQPKHSDLIELSSIEHNFPNEHNSSKIDESIFNEEAQSQKLPLPETPLICKELSKKYQTSTGTQEYIALKPISFYIQDKSILGLLGPNGAGKTTLISVLTGMYPQTKGNAWIKGLEVGYTQNNRLIGVCPQFDLLWPELSVFQHLKFYCILKGVQRQNIQAIVDQFITDFDLTEWRDRPSKQLSGGMKRRLSIANALIGHPSLVFLDEPSSGLDPAHRRQLWNILLKYSKKTSILLTTHLMEEAEVLCDKIGIIDHGNLKCIGRLEHLKEKFGKGYLLCANFEETEQHHKQTLIKQIQEKLNEVEVIDELSSRVTFKISKFNLMKSIQIIRELKVRSWEINQPSLYDVFMEFVK